MPYSYTYIILQNRRRRCHPYNYFILFFFFSPFFAVFAIKRTVCRALYCHNFHFVIALNKCVRLSLCVSVSVHIIRYSLNTLPIAVLCFGYLVGAVVCMCLLRFVPLNDNNTPYIILYVFIHRNTVLFKNFSKSEKK